MTSLGTLRSTLTGFEFSVGKEYVLNEQRRQPELGGVLLTASIIVFWLHLGRNTDLCEWIRLFRSCEIMP